MCVSLYIFVSCLVFFVLYFCILFLVVSPWLPMRILWDLRVRESHIPFLHILLWKFLWKIFNFCIVFLSFGVVCAPFDWFLISNFLVASLYISRMCMIERLSIVWFSTFHDNSTSHVRCYAYLVHLNIDLWCWYVKIFGLRTIYFVIGLSIFHFKKKEEKRE